MTVVHIRKIHYERSAFVHPVPAFAAVAVGLPQPQTDHAMTLKGQKEDASGKSICVFGAVSSCEYVVLFFAIYLKINTLKQLYSSVFVSFGFEWLYVET